MEDRRERGEGSEGSGRGSWKMDRQRRFGWARAGDADLQAGADSGVRQWTVGQAAVRSQQAACSTVKIFYKYLLCGQVDVWVWWPGLGTRQLFGIDGDLDAMRHGNPTRFYSMLDIPFA
jgi:hypothetical protein